MIETHDGSEQVIKQHVWGTQYVDELLQLAINGDPGTDNDCVDGSEDESYWVCQDANYNVTDVFESDGDLKERYTYTPYGRRSVFKPADSSDTFGTVPIAYSQPVQLSSEDQPYGICDVGHQGLMHDKEFGLIYNRARYLHPVLGRFTSRDPLGYVDGMSLYEYVMSSPIVGLDLYGLATILIHGIDNTDWYDAAEKAIHGLKSDEKVIRFEWGFYEPKTKITIKDSSIELDSFYLQNAFRLWPPPFLHKEAETRILETVTKIAVKTWKAQQLPPVDLELLKIIFPADVAKNIKQIYEKNRKGMEAGMKKYVKDIKTRRFGGVTEIFFTPAGLKAMHPYPSGKSITVFSGGLFPWREQAA